MPRTLPAFAVASLLPAFLLVAGALLGGGWLILAVGYMTLLAGLLDQSGLFALSEAPEAEEATGHADLLLVVIGVAHLGLLPLAVLAVAGAGSLGGVERALAFAGFGLYFGQVSHPAAHELIHRSDRRLHRLGVLVYITLLFGHHVSAHRLVHHRHVATPDDPNTARRGEGFYRFALRAWFGSFRAGLQAERARQAGWRGWLAYAAYCGGGAACLAAAVALAGPAGGAAHIGLAAYAVLQLLLSDYVQHYGLTRALRGGRREPVGDAHSWDGPPGFSALMMLNAPRHADHHAHPGRPFPALHLPRGAPRLPHPLPVMALVALVPPLWRRMMNPRLAIWSRERDGAASGAGPGDLAG